MTVRWTVRTANDRGALRTENRVLFEAPKEKDHSPSGLFLLFMEFQVCEAVFRQPHRGVTGTSRRRVIGAVMNDSPVDCQNRE